MFAAWTAWWWRCWWRCCWRWWWWWWWCATTSARPERSRVTLLLDLALVSQRLGLGGHVVQPVALPEVLRRGLLANGNAAAAAGAD